MTINSKAFALEAGNGASGTGLTTATFDSTGYSHIVLAFKHEGAPTTLTPSDNKSSTGWNSLTKINHTNGDLSAQLFWAAIGSPGTGHTATITCAAGRPWRTLSVWLIDADAAMELDAEAAVEGNGTAVDAGTLSTSGASVVSFLFVGAYAGGSYTPSLGWDEDSEGSVVGQYSASRGPETTTPINPAATWSTSGTDWAAVAASLREVTGGGASVGHVPPSRGRLTPVLMAF